jgi:hypothetical protein
MAEGTFMPAAMFFPPDDDLLLGSQDKGDAGLTEEFQGQADPSVTSVEEEAEGPAFRGGFQQAEDKEVFQEVLALDPVGLVLNIPIGEDPEGQGENASGLRDPGQEELRRSDGALVENHGDRRWPRGHSQKEGEEAFGQTLGVEEGVVQKTIQPFIPVFKGGS